jgi:hypothetical protein
MVTYLEGVPRTQIVLELGEYFPAQFSQPQALHLTGDGPSGEGVPRTQIVLNLEGYFPAQIFQPQALHQRGDVPSGPLLHS